jgi:hypothetical protein
MRDGFPGQNRRIRVGPRRGSGGEGAVGRRDTLVVGGSAMERQMWKSTGSCVCWDRVSAARRISLPGVGRGPRTRRPATTTWCNRVTWRSTERATRTGAIGDQQAGLQSLVEPAGQVPGVGLVGVDSGNGPSRKPGPRPEFELLTNQSTVPVESASDGRRIPVRPLLPLPVPGWGAGRVHREPGVGRSCPHAQSQNSSGAGRVLRVCIRFIGGTRRTVRQPGSCAAGLTIMVAHGDPD